MGQSPRQTNPRSRLSHGGGQQERKLKRKSRTGRRSNLPAAAKGRGVKRGGFRKGAYVPRTAREKGNAAMARIANERAADIAPVIAELRQAGARSLNAIADRLNKRGIPTARGGHWSATQVARVLARIDSE
jgi:Recombinase